MYNNDPDTEWLISQIENGNSGASLLAVSDPVTSDDANGFKAVILDLLGDYEGVVVEYSYENTNGYTSYVREIQPDYPWIASAVIFLAVLWCTFRMGAAILCKK